MCCVALSLCGSFAFFLLRACLTHSVALLCTAAQVFQLIHIKLGVIARLGHGLSQLIQAERSVFALFPSALGNLAQEVCVLTELRDLPLGGSVLLQQLLGAQRDGQQARLVQDLRRVEEAAVAHRRAVWQRAAWALSCRGRRGRGRWRRGRG